MLTNIPPGAVLTGGKTRKARKIRKGKGKGKGKSRSKTQKH